MDYLSDQDWEQVIQLFLLFYDLQNELLSMWRWPVTFYIVCRDQNLDSQDNGSECQQLEIHHIYHSLRVGACGAKMRLDFSDPPHFSVDRSRHYPRIADWKKTAFCNSVCNCAGSSFIEVERIKFVIFSIISWLLHWSKRSFARCVTSYKSLHRPFIVLCYSFFKR